jgi:hypothetical protein
VFDPFHTSDQVFHVHLSLYLHLAMFYRLRVGRALLDPMDS